MPLPAGHSIDRRNFGAKFSLRLDFWLDNDFRNANWWQNCIGIPGYDLGPALLAMRPELTEGQKARGAKILGHCNLSATSGQWGEGGDRLFWCRSGLMLGLFTDDAALVHRAFELVYENLRSGHGVNEDFSEWEHGPLLYNHSSGAQYLTESARLIRLAEAVGLEVPPASKMLLEEYMLEGGRWMSRGLFLDPAAAGREIARPRMTAACSSGSSLPQSAST